MDKQAELNEFAEDVKSLSSREKAALVVVSLGSDRASQIYKYLSEQGLRVSVAGINTLPKATWGRGMYFI